MESHSKRILFIEDDDSTRWLLKQTFKRVPGEFEFASSAVEGKAKIDQSAFDLIVCDYHLGDGIGTEVFRHLKESNPTTPFILYTSIDDVLPELKNKNFHFIQKPEVGELLDKTKHLLFES